MSGGEFLQDGRPETLVRLPIWEGGLFYTFHYAIVHLLPNRGVGLSKLTVFKKERGRPSLTQNVVRENCPR